MKIKLSILLSLCALFAHAQISSEIVNIRDYTNLSVTGRCEVIYEQKSGEGAYLRVEAGQAYIKNVDISSKTGSLSISTNMGNAGVNFYEEGANIKIYTNSTELTEVSVTGNSKVIMEGDINTSKMKLSVSGSGILKTTEKIKAANSDIKIYIKGNGVLEGGKFESNELALYISGSGKIGMENARASSLSASISGSGTVKIDDGAAHETFFRVKGNGIIDALNVKSQESDNKINGSGKIHANSSGPLKGTIYGSGRIFYSGTPSKIDKTVYGKGKVLPSDLPDEED